MTGRVITITDGGALVFQEDNETGTNIATIIVDNLTGDRTLRIPDKDCIIGGLGVGEYYKVSEGGTGLDDVPTNNLLIGTGTDVMGLIPAPVSAGYVLSYDDITNSLSWAPITLAATGEINTGINYDPVTPGVYATKVGSEFRFRNIVAGTGVSVTQSPTYLTVSLVNSAIVIPFSQVTGTLPQNRGGTAITSYGDRELMVSSSGTLTKLTAPSGGNRFLRSNVANTGLEWAAVQTTFSENFSGELEYPSNSTYTLSPKWPYACNVVYFSMTIDAGSCQVFFTKSNSTSGITEIGTLLRVGGTSPSPNQAVTGSLAIGDKLQMVVSNISSDAKGLAFAIELTRTIG